MEVQASLGLKARLELSVWIKLIRSSENKEEVKR